MDIVSEAPDIVEDNQLPVDWPSIGSIVLEDLEASVEKLIPYDLSMKLYQ